MAHARATDVRLVVTEPSADPEGDRDSLVPLPPARKLRFGSTTDEILKISRSAVYNRMSSGEIASFRLGRSVRTRRSWIEEYIQQHKRGNNWEVRE